MITTPAIATILHRSTLAAMAGERTFDRGEACFLEGRVLGVRAGRGLGRARPPRESLQDPVSLLPIGCVLWITRSSWRRSCGARMKARISA